MRPAFALSVFAAATTLPAVAAAQVPSIHPEIQVGCDASGKLVVKFFASKPFPLAASRFPWTEGYADAVPGIATIYESVPDQGWFTADPASRLVMVLEGADDGITCWNDRGTGTMRAGETFHLGNPPFDSHPVWTIAKGAARKPYVLRMRVRDLAGRHAESDVFAPAFVPDDGQVGFSCPMACGGGPIAEQPGPCGECGMALRLLSGRSWKVTVTPETPPAGDGRIRAGADVALRFRIEAPDGKPAKEFEIVHEKRLHLLMASNDLAWFAHEHPELQPDGTFTMPFRFPHGGRFTLFHDFTPPRVGMQVVPVELEVAGEAPPPAALKPSGARSEIGDGYAAELEAASPIRSIQMQKLKFRLSRGGKPLTDLEPFLGAMGHLIVVSEDRQRFVHSHPLEAPKGAAAAKRNGPEVTFSAQFPVPGLYKAWAQFQHRGRVLTAPFVIEVASPHAR